MSKLDDLLTEFPFEDFIQLATFWRASCAGDCIPVRSSVDLMALYRLAPRLVVLDAEGDLDGAVRFKWRYAGGAMRTLAGFELTGLYDDDVYPSEQLCIVREIYGTILKTGDPHAWRYHVVSRDGQRDYWYYHRLLLPMADDAGRSRHLLGVYVLED